MWISLFCEDYGIYINIWLLWGLKSEVFQSSKDLEYLIYPYSSVFVFSPTADKKLTSSQKSLKNKKAKNKKKLADLEKMAEAEEEDQNEKS